MAVILNSRIAEHSIKWILTADIKYKMQVCNLNWEYETFS